MQVPEKSAGIVPFFQGEGQTKFLLLHYQAGHWGFPKGHIEQGETEEQAAMRGLYEETGLEHIFLINGFQEGVNYYYTKDGKPTYKEVVFFLAQSPKKEVVLSDEHIGFRWLTFETALKQITFKDEQNLLKKANHWIITKKPSHGGSFSGYALV